MSLLRYLKRKDSLPDPKAFVGIQRVIVTVEKLIMLLSLCFLAPPPELSVHIKYNIAVVRFARLPSSMRSRVPVSR